MKGLYKAGTILTRIMEICHYVAAGLFAAAAAAGAFVPSLFDRIMVIDEGPTVLTTYGLEIGIMKNGAMDMTAVIIFALGGAVMCLMIARIFGNINRILTASQDSSPFTAGNIARLKEIAILSILQPLAAVIISAAARLIAGPFAAETGLSMDGIVMGVVVLCLTAVFAHGAELEQDVEGLV